METTWNVHGFVFIRSGSCLQCGACGCDKGCPHHYTQDGKSYCAIYADRRLICRQCSDKAGEEITHESCIHFPDNPWVTVCRDAVCGFTFRRSDGGSMDDLPFLGEGPYLR